jgi:plastocyanin
MHKTILFALVILSGLSAGALAANQVIHQQGRVFSSESVTIKKGDALTFVNDDSIPHNIMSGTKGSEFNLDGCDVQGNGRRAGDLRHPPADEDDGEGYGLEHDPEKWIPVFRKDHAQTKS